MGVLALGWLVMTLWNWVVPALFAGALEIDYLHAMGVLLLSKILFGGFRGGCGFHRRWHQHRWEQMTPEERERVQSGLRGWCNRQKRTESQPVEAKD